MASNLDIMVTMDRILDISAFGDLGSLGPPAPFLGVRLDETPRVALVSCQSQRCLHEIFNLIDVTGWSGCMLREHLVTQVCNASCGRLGWLISVYKCMPSCV